MTTSRKFATSPDILVAKEKKLVVNATVLVAILSPVLLLNLTMAISMEDKKDFILEQEKNISTLFSLNFCLILQQQR